MSYMLVRNGRRFGPYDGTHLCDFASRGIIAPVSVVVMSDGKRVSAGRMAGLKFGAFLNVDPPPPVSPRRHSSRPIANTVNPIGSTDGGRRRLVVSRVPWIVVPIMLALSRLPGCREFRDSTELSRPGSAVTIEAHRQS